MQAAANYRPGDACDDVAAELARYRIQGRQ
jgi:hypothetical protein